MAIKLNSTRLLSKRKIPFTVYEFPESIHSADGVAEALGKPPEMVYKTLVVLRNTPKTKPMLIMAAANRNLNLKRVAQIVGEKKVRMAAHREAERLTGLKVGGISAPALLNRGFDVFIDEAAQLLDTILVSGGKRGVNIELPVQDLVLLTGAKWIHACD